MKNRFIRKNPIVLGIFVCLFVLITCFCFLACMFSFQQNQMDIDSNLHSQLSLIIDEFDDILNRNWQIYLPITTNGTHHRVAQEYFTDFSEDTMKKNGILYVSMLKEMAASDNRIKWIVLFSPNRSVNYIYVRDLDRLLQLPETFPYYEELAQKKSIREVYPRRKFAVAGRQLDTIAVAGGTFTDNMQDSIVVGYDTGSLNNLLTEHDGLPSLQFCVSWHDTVIYSSELDEIDVLNSLDVPDKNGRFFVDNEAIYLQYAEKYMSGTKTFFLVNLWEYLLFVGQWSIIVFFIVFIIAGLAVVTYFGILKLISKEVNVIIEGLAILGNNQLDYRITEKFHQPEMRVIAQNINQMSKRLKDNMECMVNFEKLQAKAEFSELQAKFNPHFLYNTLEIFRTRCFENGDETTANMIAETATLFRGFLGDRKFIPMREELSFCKRYLSIYHARYEDSVEVMFDIDSDVLQYGIIRNLFQPLIENYFEHGYDPSKPYNYILIKGELVGEDGILFAVTDNGKGMDSEKYLELVNSLQSPISSDMESYGLKNLNQRIKMFYGEEFGLTVKRNREEGLTFEVLIKKQEYVSNA